MQLWMGFSKFLNFPQVPNVSNEVGPWFSLETWSSTTHATYSTNQNCIVPLWPLEGGHVSEEYFLPAAIFKKMYQLLTKKRKGNFCVKKNYNNNIPIQVPIPAQGWFVVQLQHTRLVAWSSSCSNAIGMVDLSSENPTKTNQHWWLVVYFEGKEEGYVLFNSVGGILSLFMGVRPLPLFKE